MKNLYRYAAFTETPDGGNPAGVWIGKKLPSVEEMQKIAADVGYSETAFICPDSGQNRIVRYYSPEMEVSFCGHATIASAVAIANNGESGKFIFSTLAGEIPVEVEKTENGFQASLISVEPSIKAIDREVLHRIISILNWKEEDIHETITPMLSYAGAWHLILAVKDLSVLAKLNYDYEKLKLIMKQENLTTLQLIFRESETVFCSRNPFPVGGVVEDPATGAAAAALGGYLRFQKLIEIPNSITIRQGEDMGRPSILNVTIPERGGIKVSGTAQIIEK